MLRAKGYLVKNIGTKLISLGWGSSGVDARKGEGQKRCAHGLCAHREGKFGKLFDLFSAFIHILLGKDA